MKTDYLGTHSFYTSILTALVLLRVELPVHSLILTQNANKWMVDFDLKKKDDKCVNTVDVFFCLFFVSEWQLINVITALAYVQEVCVLRIAKKSKHS